MLDDNNVIKQRDPGHRLESVLSEYQQVAGALGDWLKQESEQWRSTTPTDQNLAKQIALQAVGKTAVFYGGVVTAPVAHRWKTSWNEISKNVAFWGEYPEASRSDALGWTSHPIEKPFAIFDIISNLEQPHILKLFEAADRSLSGLRPKATPIHLKGDTVQAQLLWGCLLADVTSCYLAMLNGVTLTGTLNHIVEATE